jgi:peptide chain release factor 1
MRDQLEQKLSRFRHLESQMSDPAIQADSNKMAAVAREHGSLAKQATKYSRFKDILEEISGVREMAESDDEDERDMAEEELKSLIKEREHLWSDLLESTIGGEDANRSRCIMEIRAGAGGDEASLFAGDLFRMYKRYAEIKGWKVEILNTSQTEVGGFKDISMAFDGEGVFRELQYESGGHRVQRVPETEAKGRIHTSAATVAVMPEPEDVEVDLKPDDYRVDKFHASGPGGQHVNKTESAIRLTHFDTGIVVQCQDGKSQHKNLAQALRELKARIYDRYRMEEDQKRADTRKLLIGSGDRSQRIRTYNFPENRVTDHRIGFRASLDQVLAGDISVVTNALLEHDRNALRSAMGTLD